MAQKEALFLGGAVLCVVHLCHAAWIILAEISTVATRLSIVFGAALSCARFINFVRLEFSSGQALAPYPVHGGRN